MDDISVTLIVLDLMYRKLVILKALHLVRAN